MNLIRRRETEKRKGDFFFPLLFFLFFLVLRNFDLFSGFSGLDTGIARIASPSSQERGENKNKERRDETENPFFLVLRNFEFFFFRFFGTRYGYCENRLA